MNENQSVRQRQVAEFIANLSQLDAGGRARLKRNAGNSLGEARNIHRAFYQALPYGISERRHEDYFLIATLFPLADSRTNSESLGTTLRGVRNADEKLNSLDRRFQTLIDCDREQLPFRLRQIVRLIAASKEPIDWDTLLNDLLSWEWDGHPVQLRWARDYFVGKAE